jgi:hypothetical protein
MLDRQEEYEGIDASLYSGRNCEDILKNGIVSLKLMTCYDMIHLTAIGLKPGGSNTYLHTNNT